MAMVLKTIVAATSPWVRIPRPPRTRTCGRILNDRRAGPPATVDQLAQALAVTLARGRHRVGAGITEPVAIAPIGVHSSGTPNRVRKWAMILGGMPKNTASSPSSTTASRIRSALLRPGMPIQIHVLCRPVARSPAAPGSARLSGRKRRTVGRRHANGYVGVLSANWRVRLVRLSAMRAHRTWDDDWTCIGGPAELVAGFLRHPDLQARSVALGQDATPPGHRAM
jgi:hypothetical protein